MNTIKIIKAASIILVLLVLASCGKDLPIAPQQQNSQTTSKKTTEEIRFLKAKTLRLNKVFSVSQLITSAKGGSILVGDETTGLSSLSFDPGDVIEDVNVNFWWDSQNFQAEFSPHGISFADSVTIRLSYKDANLNGINEDDLRIWYYDANQNLWELTGRVVNKQEKYVEGKTTHFSKYAIGAE